MFAIYIQLLFAKNLPAPQPCLNGFSLTYSAINMYFINTQSINSSIHLLGTPLIKHEIQNSFHQPYNRFINRSIPPHTTDTVDVSLEVPDIPQLQRLVVRPKIIIY